MTESPYDFDLDPVSFLTVGTQGPPGQRTFFLQAAQGRVVVTLVIEKEQAIALAASIEHLLAAAREPGVAAVDEAAVDTSAMALLEPVAPEFRVVELGLGADEDRGVIVLVALEAPDDEPGKRARFVADYEQMRRFARRALVVAGRGRPTCPLCGRAIEPDGHHLCPRSNGHDKPVAG